MRRRSETQRGFTLLVVAVLMVVLGLAGLGLLQLIRLDLSITGQSHRSVQARDSAEGGAMEVINNVATSVVMPDLGAPMTALSVNAPAPANTPFVDPVVGNSYKVKINLLRVAPMSESSFAWTRATVYEIDSQSSFHNGDSQAAVRAEVYKAVAFEPGTVMPNKHYR
jgi:hypothetical protein